MTAMTIQPLDPPRRPDLPVLPLLRSRRRERPRALGLALALAASLAAALPGPGAAAQGPEVAAQAQELLDAGRAQEALTLLEGAVGAKTGDARLLLLRSTARIMVGQVEPGRRDLERALELDPDLRQGWMNRAALDIADERYDDALAALSRAEELDPGAPDNDLNLGAVHLLKGDLAVASDRFQRYLSASEGAAESYYLVASNYAVAGYAALAVEHLRLAFDADERTRLRARTDPTFQSMATNPSFQKLLNSAPHPPPPGAYSELRRFPDDAYEGGEGPLLGAVLDTLQLTGQRFDSRVEVTPAWAVIWGDIRIVVRDTPGGGGSVELSAAAQRFTPDEWRRRTQSLLERLGVRLAAGRPGGPRPPADGGR